MTDDQKSALIRELAATSDHDLLVRLVVTVEESKAREVQCRGERREKEESLSGRMGAVENEQAEVRGGIKAAKGLAALVGGLAGIVGGVVVKLLGGKL